MRLKAAAKALRQAPGVNWVLTQPLKHTLSMLGTEWAWPVRHLPRSGGVRARLPNGATLRLWSKGDDWVSNQVFWRDWAGYEPETTPLFYRLARNARATIDVGAHVGFYTVLAALANPAGRVFAFEPMAAACDRLLRHVALNRVGNVEWIPSAVGDVDGEVDLYFPRGNLMPCSAGLNSELYAPWAEHMDTQLVPCVRLDTFVRERWIENVDLVKIDVEGAELNVLAGAQSVLASQRPDIVCEVLVPAAKPDALRELLAPHGYSFYLLTPEGVSPRPRPEAHPEWMNYLFTTRRPEELWL
jgi:FkbM family methyltransferase